MELEHMPLVWQNSLKFCSSAKPAKLPELSVLSHFPVDWLDEVRNYRFPLHLSAQNIRPPLVGVKFRKRLLPPNLQRRHVAIQYRPAKTSRSQSDHKATLFALFQPPAV
jgi:hypothetical protein